MSNKPKDPISKIPHEQTKEIPKDIPKESPIPKETLKEIPKEVPPKVLSTPITKAIPKVIPIKNQDGIIVRVFRPIGNIFSKASVFLLGVGISYMYFNSHFMVYLKKSDELMKNEIHSLKSLIESSQNNHSGSTNLGNSKH